jgi:hypothetical protein
MCRKSREASVTIPSKHDLTCVKYMHAHQAMILLSVKHFHSNHEVETEKKENNTAMLFYRNGHPDARKDGTSFQNSMQGRYQSPSVPSDSQ